MADTVQSTEKRLLAFIVAVFLWLVRHRRRVSGKKTPYYIAGTAKKQTELPEKETKKEARLRKPPVSHVELKIHDDVLKGLEIIDTPGGLRAAGTESQKNMDFFLSALDFSRRRAILLYELNNLKPPLWRD